MVWLLRLLIITGLTLHAGAALAALRPEVSATTIRDFTRVTFNWPEKIRFRVEPQANGVTLIFSQPTDINLGQIQSGLGELLKSSSRSSDGTKVTLTFNKPYRVRHFVSGNANGIDILGASVPTPTKQTDKAKEELKAKEAPKEAPKQPAAATDSSPKALLQQPVQEADLPKETQTAQVKATPAPTEAATSASEPAESAAAPKPEAEAVVAKASESQNTEVQEDTKAATENTSQDLKAANEAKAADESEVPEAPQEESSATKETAPDNTTLVSSETPAEAAPTSATEPTTAPAEAEQTASEEQPTPAAVSATDNPFLITTYNLATGTEIRFPWVERTGAAVFTRGDVIWVVFNHEQNVNMDLLRTVMPISIKSIENVPVAGHLVLRMETDGTVFAKIHQPKNTAQWWVTLSRYPQIPAEVIEPEIRSGSTLASHIFISELQYDKPITFTDPVIGDELSVVTFYTPSRGIYPQREFAELTLLPSAQGVAFAKKNDFAEVRQLRNGFRITSRDGLSLSENLPKLELAELETEGASITWFPYRSWEIQPEEFIETRRNLEAQLADASDVRANSLRLKLAQMYLGLGMGNEALAWLQMIEENDPSYFKERDLIALRGAAHFINDDFEQAKAAFKDEALQGESELKVWQQALSVFDEERPRFDYEDFYPTYISKYPPKMLEKLAILAADNYINRRSYNRAFKTLNTLASSENINPLTESYVYFLLGKIAAEKGDIEGAKKLWEPLLDVEAPRFVRATTQFALTTLLYNNGQIDIKQAIERLERVRIVWRGDALEMTLLNYLAQLYAQDSNPLMALRTWKELIDNYADAPLAITVAGDMVKAFNKLFAEGEADKMAPLDALSVFYEFRQLVPIGEQGDGMIQSLANRLITVDLLDRAAALIEHQIQFRQEKLPRSKLGTQLAMIYLLDDNPARALEVLELTGFGEMPEDLARERQRIAAMAYAEKGEAQRAISMLSSDDSREADRLRLHLYWRESALGDVIANAERLLGNRPDVTAPLNEEETEQLLQLAIAYMFERNTVQLQYLNRYYMPLLADSPNKDIFAFVSNASDPVDPRQFSEFSGQIGRFETFMKQYKDRVENGGLSSIFN